MTEPRRHDEEDQGSDLFFDGYFETYNEILKKNQRILSPSGKISYFAYHKISILKRILPENPRTLLEYGCGIGNNLGFLLQLFPGVQIWGCDTSEKSLEAARKRYPDVHFFPVSDRDDNTRQFDCVLIGDVIHHIPPERRMYYLKRISDCIRPGGYCVFFEHNPYNPLTRRLVSTCPFDARARLISLRNLRNLLLEQGLQVRISKYCFFFPEFLKVFDRFEDPLSLVPIGGKYYVLAVKAA